MDAGEYQAAFGRHVRELRLRARETQEEVAHRAGVHVTYLSGIERGVRNPSLKNIRAIAQALDVETGELFAFEGQCARGDAGASRTLSEGGRRSHRLER